MKNILHITGQTFSNKLGGLERWYLANAKFAKANHDCRLHLSYGLDLPDPDILSKFNDSGIHSYILPYNYSIKNLLFFIRFLRRHKIEVVHGHFENTLFFLVVAKLMGKKTFWHLHMGNYYSNNHGWKKNLKLQLGVRYFQVSRFLQQFFLDKIYFVSDGILKEHRKFFSYLNYKCEVFYLGLNSDDYRKVNVEANNKEKSISNKEIVLGCIAFHEPIKGLDILLKAIGLLSEKGYKVTLLQIGGSLEKNNDLASAALKDLAIKVKAGDTVQWLGIQQDVFHYLKQMDIYVQPSRHEAMPFSIMEAMLAGLPIIATDIGGIPELVKHNINGFLFPKEDHIKCAEYIENLILNPDLRMQMGLQSNEFIKDKKFNTEYNLERLYLNY